MKSTNQTFFLISNFSMFVSQYGRSIQTSSTRSPCRNALLTSSCIGSHFIDIANVSRTFIVTDLAIGRKGLYIIKPFLLRVSFGHKSCFVSFNGTISFVLDFVHPFAPYGILSKGKGNNNPSLICLQGFNSSVTHRSHHSLKGTT